MLTRPLASRVITTPGPRRRLRNSRRRCLIRPSVLILFRPPPLLHARPIIIIILIMQRYRLRALHPLLHLLLALILALARLTKASFLRALSSIPLQRSPLQRRSLAHLRSSPTLPPLPLQNLLGVYSEPLIARHLFGTASLRLCLFPSVYFFCPILPAAGHLPFV